MEVRDFMTQGVQTVHPTDSLHSAAKAMWEHDCGALPVVDDNGRVVAMLTDRDVCMASYFQGKSLADIPVERAMSHTIFTCRPADTLVVAEAAMRKHQVRRLPVVDTAGRVVGILSINDIAIEVAEDRGQERPGVSREEVGATLAAISRHRMGAPVVV